VSEGDNASVLRNMADWGAVSPALSITDVTVTEGNAGSVNAVFALRLSSPSSQSVTVSYATGDADATAGRDYSAASGMLTFAPGETVKYITVAVLGDLVDEYDQQFLVSLSGASHAEITVAQATATILDDDPPPTISIADASIQEGDRGTKRMSFTVTLSAASEKEVSFYYDTSDGTATTADADYQGTGGWLNFAPDERTKTISVVIPGDRELEPDETFYVNLSGVVDATIADGQAIGKILNNDKKRGNKRR